MNNPDNFLPSNPAGFWRKPESDESTDNIASNWIRALPSDLSRDSDSQDLQQFADLEIVLDAW